MELKDTIGYMTSAEYRNRFVGEYLQVKIRCEKLSKMIEKYELKQLNFTPKCPIELLKSQLSIMERYIAILQERAKIENIDLEMVYQNEELYKIADEVLERYKGQKRDYWNWEDFKNNLRYTIENKYHKSIDFRSVLGKEILQYARGEWND